MYSMLNWDGDFRQQAKFGFHMRCQYLQDLDNISETLREEQPVFPRMLIGRRHVFF